MLIYHDDEASPNCLKTKILLYELDAEFEQVSHDFRRGDLRKEPFIGKFPNAKVPALEDGEIGIAESAAIALHLAARFDRFLPREPAAKAHAYQAVALEAALLAPTIGGQGLFGELGKPEGDRDMGRIESLTAEAKRVGDVLARLLADGRDYFAGSYSIADMQLFPGLYKTVKHGLIDSPPLAAWAERVARHSNVARAMAEYPAYRD